MGAALASAAGWWPAGLRGQNVAPPLRPTAVQGFPRAPQSAEDWRREREALAYRFAPVFVQALSPEGLKPSATGRANGRAFEDFFLRMNFDGDEELSNNAEHLASHCNDPQPWRPCDLRAFVYYAVQETEPAQDGTVLVFLHYAYYHPRDPKRFRGHAHDVEGALVVVERGPGSRDERLVSVALQAHDTMPLSAAAGLTLVDAEGQARADATHVVVRSQVGHRCGLLASLLGRSGHGTEFGRLDDLDTPEALTYVPASAPESPSTAPALPGVRRATYRLIALTHDLDGDGQPDTDADGDDARTPLGPGLWDQRDDARVFGAASCLRASETAELTVESASLCSGQWLSHGLQGGACGANLPWGWKQARGARYRGGLFLEPALHARPSGVRSAPGPYLFDRRRGTTPGNVYRARLLHELRALPPASPPPACRCRQAQPPADVWCDGVPDEPAPRCRVCTPFEPADRGAVPVLRAGWLPDLGLATCPSREDSALALQRPLHVALARERGSATGSQSLSRIEGLPLEALDGIEVEGEVTAVLSCQGARVIELSLTVLCRDGQGGSSTVESTPRRVNCDRLSQRVRWQAHELACPPTAAGGAVQPVLLSLDEREGAPPEGRVTLYSIEGLRLAH